MREVLMMRFSEIHLKGLNRPYFMRMLVERIKEAVKEVHGHVWLSDSRVYVSAADDMDEALRRTRKVFGVHSVCRAVEMDKGDFAAVCEQAVSLLKDKQGSFKVEARRSDKRYPLDSMDLNREIGHYILEKLPHLTVDVHMPDHRVYVEIRDHAYLYSEYLDAVGGMPVGTGGRAMVLLSGGIDSPVAAWMIAKRGVTMSAVHFLSPPYTSERAKDKVLSLAKILSESLCGWNVYLVPFTDIQMQIHEKCHADYTTVIMRRYMMRIANRIAKKEHAQALVTGESIGQVASQTMHALQCTDSVSELPVFRPLIGFDKQEIVDIAVKIGTFETSSLPYEDCCTVFTPRHPATKPKLDIILDGESKLDGEALMEAAILNTEIIRV
ncbi:MAG TPA: tRNA uracil 4-sulfurtransferase ThiI [Candidatus Limiplasma sp.]|nr:tRNA uracil 4-sulfurtransferase ThiI [Candidatus Limiplasma sp.]HRX08146.1 tRNA uracil 4-sulfurtransferase ThiI [Candidatus Limiplasma sp.]